MEESHPNTIAGQPIVNKEGEISNVNYLTMTYMDWNGIVTIYFIMLQSDNDAKQILSHT